MRRMMTVVVLLAAMASAHPAEAQGSLTIDVSGVRGSNQTTWTFAGSYPVPAGPFGPKDFTHDEGQLNGGDISVADDTFNLQDFTFLSATAQVVGSASGAHPLEGIHLDSDTGVLPDDDFAWIASGVFPPGETLTFSGTGTVALDIGLFLAAGVNARSISSQAATSNNPADLFMNFTAQTGGGSSGPIAQLQALVASVDALASSGVVPHGVARSLTRKLDRALMLLGAGGTPGGGANTHAAIRILSAFTRQVRGLVSGRVLPFADGAALIAGVNGVIGALSGTVDVAFTVTPDFNDFLLEFSITNQIGAGEEIARFGVFIQSGSDIPSFGIPTGWIDAGGGVSYNNNWSTDPAGSFTIGFGDTATGFIARDNGSATPPVAIDWMALTVSGQTFTGTAMSASGP